MVGMPVTIQGTVPYPPTANAAPITTFASNLQQLVAGLSQQAGQVASTANAASSSWAGTAAESFVQHLMGRSSSIQGAASSLQAAIPVLQTFAAAIETTSAAYTAAATTEIAARAGLPWTAGLLAAAIAAETAAVAAHQAAGAACAGALVAIEAKLAGVILADVVKDNMSGEDATSIAQGVQLIDDFFGDGKGGGAAAAGAALTAAANALASGNGSSDAVPPPPVDTAKMPDTSGMTEAQKFDVYKEYFKKQNIDISDPKQLPDGQRMILGLRVPTASTANGGTGQFDDRVVVVWTETKPGKNGQPPTTVRHVQEFNANTEPSAQYDSKLGGTRVNGQQIRNARDLGNDVNFDGKVDAGRLAAGDYTFERSSSTVMNRNGEAALRGTSSVRLERDVNHDGIYDERDAQAAREGLEQRVAELRRQGNRNPNLESQLLAQQQRAMQDGKSILFHRGGNTNTYSAGCQTFQGRGEWDRFWGSLGDGKSQTQYRYILQQVGK
jgi:uncharacterized protein YukE